MMNDDNFRNNKKKFLMVGQREQSSERRSAGWSGRTVVDRGATPYKNR